MKRIKNFFSIYLLFLFIIVANVAVAGECELPQAVHFITLSDIHFNPFYSCQPSRRSCLIIDKLRKASVVQWPEILAGSGKKQSSYGEDTNYALFNSSLAALKEQADKNHAAFDETRRALRKRCEVEEPAIGVR